MCLQLNGFSVQKEGAIAKTFLKQLSITAIEVNQRNFKPVFVAEQLVDDTNSDQQLKPSSAIVMYRRSFQSVSEADAWPRSPRVYCS